MSRFFSIGLCALLALAASASAAKIDWSAADTTTGAANWAGVYGSDHWMLWDFSSGRVTDPNDPGYYPKGGDNPAYVEDFYWGTPGGGGGGGGGGGQGGQTATGDVYYDLILNEGKTFEFTALFYDDSYGSRNGMAAGDVALQARLLGPNDLDDSWHEITVAQLEGGTFLTWLVTLYADDPVKAITLDVEYFGDIAYVAGFFMDNVAPAGNIPEPATVGLVMLGLVGMFVRRRKA